MTDNSEQYLGAEDYRGTKQEQPLSFEFICMQHLNRIVTIRSQEIRKSQMEKRTKVANGVVFTEEHYLPDTAEEYFSAVNSFINLLYARLHPETIKSIEEIHTKLHKQYESLIKDLINGEAKYRYEKLKEYDNLFRLLNTFLNKENYFQTLAYEETI